MAKRKPKAKEPPAPEFPKVIETFGDPMWMLRDATCSTFQKPDVGNMSVRFRRYRITVEVVDEPVEVLHERLRKLFRETNNWHEREPLERAAKSVGLEFDRNTFGKDAKPFGKGYRP